MSGTVRFDFIHFMHYVHLPENHKDFRSLWVDFPNKYFDPERGYALYQRYLSELVLADKLGFDAVVVNEHHNTAYSLMPAPNLIARRLFRKSRTRKSACGAHRPISNIRTAWRKNTPCSM